VQVEPGAGCETDDAGVGRDQQIGRDGDCGDQAGGERGECRKQA
jgi:hypothetical protein